MTAEFSFTRNHRQEAAQGSLTTGDIGRTLARHEGKPWRQLEDMRCRHYKEELRRLEALTISARERQPRARSGRGPGAFEVRAGGGGREEERPPAEADNSRHTSHPPSRRALEPAERVREARRCLSRTSRAQGDRGRDLSCPMVTHSREFRKSLVHTSVRICSPRSIFAPVMQWRMENDVVQRVAVGEADVDVC
jgi:hypothetical protein